MRKEVARDWQVVKRKEKGKLVVEDLVSTTETSQGTKAMGGGNTFVTQLRVEHVGFSSSSDQVVVLPLENVVDHIISRPTCCLDSTS